MDNSTHTPHTLLTHNKNNQSSTQLKTIFEYLKNNVATASMIEDVTGVKQKNICRYKRDLEKAGRLWEVVKANCKRTGFKAWYLTTNPDLAPQQSQLTLF